MALRVRIPTGGRALRLLEDAPRLLPMMWGPGAPSFEGSLVTVPEAICYPRPLQERIPILVGGSGERKTLRLVARYADACNFFGDVANVRHELSVLRSDFAEVGRDPKDVRVTHLGSIQVTDGPTPPPPMAIPATVETSSGHHRELAEAGVQTAIVRFPDFGVGLDSIDRFAPVIAAFR